MNTEIKPELRKKLEELCNTIGGLTIDEFFAFKQILVDKYPAFDTSKLNISSQSAANVQTSHEDAPKKNELYDIVLTAFDNNPQTKSKLIIAVREIRKLPLMQAKSEIESLPCVLVKGVKSQQDLEDLKAKYLKDINVTLELKIQA